MKDKELLSPTIRAAEPSDRETGPNDAEQIAATLNSALTWYATFVARNGMRLLPREFELPPLSSSPYVRTSDKAKYVGNDSCIECLQERLPTLKPPTRISIDVSSCYLYNPYYASHYGTVFRNTFDANRDTPCVVNNS